MFDPRDTAKKIEKLERIWGVLGPLRRISFTCRVSDDFYGEKIDSEGEAIKIEKFAIENGFETDKYAGDGGIHIESSKYMEPSVENILKWSAMFLDIIPDGGYFDGWKYPPIREVNFFPDSDRANFQSAVTRAKVLFGEEVLADPMGKMLDEDFRIDPADFLRKAQRCPPKTPQPTASAFAQWVYSLYADIFGNEDDRVRGTKMEKEIFALKHKAIRSLDDGLLQREFRGWALIHNGLHMEGGNVPYYEVPSLRVSGAPLRVSPDLVYRNNKTKEVVIVEIKNSYLSLPKNLWPNIWAQLWCYSQIDVAAEAEKVTAVAEIWAGRSARIGRRDRRAMASLRASVRRDPRAPAYDRFFRRLFDIYRGKGHG